VYVNIASLAEKFHYLSPPGWEGHLCMPCYGLWLAHVASQVTK
jgi:hypothetical protein